MSTFVFESRLAFRLSYLRVLSSPRIAGLLAHTGEMEREPRRRATDTGLLMYALIDAGLESETGRQAVGRLNAMHRRWKIENDDYLWVLGTFSVMSVRTVARLGWRPLTEAEERTVHDWYRELGTRMGITGIPDDMTSFDAWFSEYEDRTLQHTQAGERLARQAMEVVGSTVPRILRRPVVSLAPVLIDPPVRRALGLGRPGLPARLTVAVLLWGRIRRRRRAGPGRPWFEFGAANSTYPQGWTLDDLGPRSVGTRGEPS